MGTDTVEPPEGYTLDTTQPTPPEGYTLDQPDRPGILSRLGTGAMNDIKGLGELASKAADFPVDIMDAVSGNVNPLKEDTTAAAQGVNAAPAALIKQAQEIGAQPLKMIPGPTGEDFKKAYPENPFIEHPINTAAFLSPLRSGAMDAIGNVIPNPLKAAPEAAIPESVLARLPRTETPSPVEVQKSAPEATPTPDFIEPNPVNPGAAPTPKPQTGLLPQSIQDFLNNQKSKVPSDVKDFVDEKANKVGDTPLNRGTLGAYTEKSARATTLKNLGASPGQLRKIGKERAEQLADYASSKGMNDIKLGDVGRGKKIEAINKESGEMVGDMRQIAAQRGATHDMHTLLTDIHSKLGDKYSTGIDSGEQGAYNKALEEVAKTAPTPDAVAKTVSKLFAKAKNDNVAAGLRHLQAPTGPYADVARELRRANEGLLSKTLNKQGLNVYHNALEDFGASTQLREFDKMKWTKEMGGRLPPGMGIMRAGLQNTLDAVGYRGIANIQSRISKWLKENPTATTTPKELFRHYVDESAEAIHEIGDGLQ